MFKLIYRLALKIPRIDSFKKYLFIGPHPDDIEIGCGATIKKLTKLNKDITFLIATDGRIGSVDQSISEDDLVKQRQKEALESAKILGVNKVIFLPFHDGGDYILKEMEQEIFKKIIEIKPDIVFVPDYTLRLEAHEDHINVGRCSINACMKSEFIKISNKLGLKETHTVKNIGLYYTDKPNTIIRCGKEYKDKINAVRSHKSQFNKEGFKTLEKYFKLNGFRLGVKRFSTFAEGYRLLTTTHLHCFVESDLYF